MLVSLATTLANDQLTSQLAAVYTYLTANVEPKLINVGSEVPAPQYNHLPWYRTAVSGAFDAIYGWYEPASSWYTPVPYALNSIALFPTDTPTGLGWESIETTGLTPATGYQFRKFTGAGLLVLDDLRAYRRFDQSL